MYKPFPKNARFGGLTPTEYILKFRKCMDWRRPKLYAYLSKRCGMTLSPTQFDEALKDPWSMDLLNTVEFLESVDIATFYKTREEFIGINAFYAPDTVKK